MQRSKLITGLLLVLIILAAGLWFLNQQSDPPKKDSSSSPSPTPQVKNGSPTIVSTNPNPLEGAVVSANQIIEITFSHSLENEPEFRRRFDPEIEYKLELSSDKKTAKFIPEKPYELGLGYTLFILPETKFVGGGRLDGEKTFHFSTIKYRGV